MSRPRSVQPLKPLPPASLQPASGWADREYLLDFRRTVEHFEVARWFEGAEGARVA